MITLTDMMVVAALEAGVVTLSGEVRIHAIRKTLDGHVAVCGAGSALGLVPGRFSTVEAHACPLCSAMAEAQPA